MRSKSQRKRCAVCTRKRTLESYYANGRGGLRPECKACTTLATEERILARFGLLQPIPQIDWNKERQAAAEAER